MKIYKKKIGKGNKLGRNLKRFRENRSELEMKIKPWVLKIIYLPEIDH